MSVQLLKPFSVPEDRPIKVALSGGIGAGKTTVAKIWKRHDVPVISADEISRGLLEPGEKPYEAVLEKFGRGILQEGSDRIDRQRLAEIVFSSNSQRQWLESITHPIIRRRANQFLEQGEPGQVRVYDIPLLAETGTAEDYDVVVIIEAPWDRRLTNLEHGRGIKIAEAKRRVAAQVSDEKRREIAHILITNDGDLLQLAESALEVLSLLNKSQHTD